MFFYVCLIGNVFVIFSLDIRRLVDVRVLLVDFFIVIEMRFMVVLEGYVMYVYG